MRSPVRAEDMLTSLTSFTRPSQVRGVDGAGGQPSLPRKMFDSPIIFSRAEMRSALDFDRRL